MTLSTSRTARFVDASAPEGRRDIVSVQLSDGSSVRATTAVIAALMLTPPANRFVTYDVDAAGNRYNARASNVEPSPTIAANAHVAARLVVDETVTDYKQATDAAACYMRGGLFVRTWREVSALRTAGMWHVQAIEATIAHANKPAGALAASTRHNCAACDRPCFCPDYTPKDGCMTCGRTDCPAMGNDA